MVRKLLKYGAIALVIACIGIQFFTVDRDNPPVTMDIAAPANVKAILRRSCYDCHSNEVDWPWYSSIAPVSWLVASDVHRGREHFNFSTWDQYTLDEQAHLIDEIGEETDDGEMPLWFYLPLHPEARLSTEDRTTLLAWAGVSGGNDSHEHDEDEDD